MLLLILKIVLLLENCTNYCLDPELETKLLPELETEPQQIITGPHRCFVDLDPVLRTARDIRIRIIINCKKVAAIIYSLYTTSA
jgi:hypothetical protein